MGRFAKVPAGGQGGAKGRAGFGAVDERHRATGRLKGATRAAVGEMAAGNASGDSGLIGRAAHPGEIYAASAAGIGRVLVSAETGPANGAAIYNQIAHESR